MPKQESVGALLVREGLAHDPAHASALVMAGKVFKGTERVWSAQDAVAPGDRVRVADAKPFVSRGGLKLQHALAEFGVAVDGKVVLDVGASTGGFTDCLLRRGAQRVYAVDVGTNQLAYGLRADPRVVVMERTDARELRAERFDPLPQLAVCDVSFMSAKDVVRALSGWISELVVLVKPQFEATRQQMEGTGGVCPKKLHPALLDGFARFAEQHGYSASAFTASPVTGLAKGNVEYLVRLLSNND